MIERAIENWLTKTNERNYQAALCQVLMHRGERVLHSSSHGPMEQGKDIISATASGDYRAYQTKTGDIDLKEWREIRGEVEELAELPINYPGVDKSKLHQAYVVTNGIVTDPVRVEIANRNDDNAQKERHYAQVTVVAKDELLKWFIDAQGRFVPTELTDIRSFLEIYLADGRAMLPKEKLFRVLEMTAFAEKPTRKSDALDAITGSLVITSYLLNSFEQASNHYAMAEGWTVLGACLSRYALRYSVPEKQWTDSMNLVFGEIRFHLCRLRDEAIGRPDFLEGNPPEFFADGGLVLKARTTIVLGAIAAVELDAGLRKEGRNRDATVKLIKEHAKSLWFWGESAFPYMLHIIRLLEAAGEEPLAASLVNELFTALVDINYDQKGIVYAPPYYSVEEVLTAPLPDQLERPDYLGFAGSSFVLVPMLEMVVRRQRRDLVNAKWRKLTHVHLHEFVPDKEEDFLAWRTKEGANKSFFSEQTQSWAALLAAATSETTFGAALKSSLIRALLPYYVMVCPHRATKEVLKVIDDQKHPFIVILGWGSLIWDPRELPTLGEWQSDGPVLPIEFSRISSGNRLTLVIDPEKGAQVPTRYIRSPRTKLEDAVADLLRREGMNSDDGIGIVDRSRGQATGRLPAIVKTIEQWAMQHDIDAVIWTDLPSNFQERSGHEFTPEAAAAHLQSLTGDHLRRAKEYINNAPTEIDTAARRFVANAGLL